VISFDLLIKYREGKVMEVILIGGSYDRKLAQANPDRQFLNLYFYETEGVGKEIKEKSVTYEKTSAVIDGYPAYKFIKEAN
jgi:hypothetical protein